MSSDRILVNAGGRLFHTTTTTLASSGSQYFHALLYLPATGSALPGAKRARPDDECFRDYDSTDGVDSSIFIDRDPDLFADVLFFMRSGGRLSAKTKQDPARLEDLVCEADFFIYDRLKSACLESLEREKPWQGFLSLSGQRIGWIRIRKGQVVYIVSATLTGLCSVDGNLDNSENNDATIEDKTGCRIKTCGDNDTGDFRLIVFRYDTTYDIAHVGFGHIHAGKNPPNVDFRQDMRLYLEGCDNNSPRVGGHVLTSKGVYDGADVDDDEDTRYVQLSSRGSGRWDIVFWAGDKSAIPNQYCTEPVGNGVMQSR